MISLLHPKSLFYVVKNRHLKLSFDAVHWNTNTLFYHVHDGDFEIRPNEPKLIIGVHVSEKKTQKQEKIIFFDNW